jgi:hypothetical protein
MSVALRPARADELERAQELIVSSVNNLTERHGFGAMASVRPADFQLFSFNEDPGGFWIAEEGVKSLGPPSVGYVATLVSCRTIYCATNAREWHRTGVAATNSSSRRSSGSQDKSVDHDNLYHGGRVRD